jgi:UDP-N-acetylglucosamine acyltransferase
MIHETAIVSRDATIGKNVSVGPYAIIEKGVKISDNCRIGPYAHILPGTSLGESCVLHSGVVLGDIPQDLSFKNGSSFLEIGKRNIFREYVNVHRGTVEGSKTIVGNDNYLMTSVHVAHNCNIANNVIIASGSVLGGYVRIEDEVFISGNSGVHQFVRIGRLSMIAGISRAIKDVPPFMLIYGNSKVMSLNTVGIRRSSVSKEAMSKIKQAYKVLYCSALPVPKALAELKKIDGCPEIDHIIDFIRNSKRGICSANHK